MGKYSETRYANMIPTFVPAPLPASEASGPQKSNMRVYETLADLPATSTSKGNTAFVKATNKLYVWNGVGWYLVAEVTNASPSSITGVNASYDLASDGTATTITAVATDPEGMALTWSSSVTAGSLNGTTVSNVDNVFTVTPHATNATTFTLTFSVTDGVNSSVSAVSGFTLAFGTWAVANRSATINPPSYVTNNDNFGHRNHISGDGNTMSISFSGSLNPAFSVSLPGEVMIYTRSGTSWNLQLAYSPSDASANEYWGASGCPLSYDGNTMAVASTSAGSYGKVKILTRSGTTWSVQQELEPTRATYPTGTGVGGNNALTSGEAFGLSLALSDDGNTLVVGAQGRYQSKNNGRHEIWTRSGTTWTRQVSFHNSGWTLDDRGGEVAISGDGLTVATSAGFHDPGGNSSAGQVWVWKYNGTSWDSSITGGEQAKLTHTDASTVNATDRFGGYNTAGEAMGLSYDGNYLVVGAYNQDLGGSAYVFLRTGTTWAQEAKIQPSTYPTTYSSDVGNGWGAKMYGLAVCINGDGDKIGVGAPQESSAHPGTYGAGGGNTYGGAVHMWTRSGTTWTHGAICRTASLNYAKLGDSVSMDKNGYYMVAGAWKERHTADNTGDFLGRVHVFHEST
tara:strand:+ start:20 stop:1894 length:1875 start_codon:yes stop_codon:yes gene_type:complete